MKQSIEKYKINISIGIAIALILSIVGMTFNVVKWQITQELALNELNDRVTHLGDKYVTIRAELTIISEKATSRDIQLAEINTKLNSIETILVEIKQDLKD